VCVTAIFSCAALRCQPFLHSLGFILLWVSFPVFGIITPSIAAQFEMASSIPENANEPFPCTPEPTGFGLPGFQPGTSRSSIEQMVGSPTDIQSGYWGNTTAYIYNLVPNEVSLGFLFDNASDRLRQTEASFAISVDPDTILSTLNSMLGCQLNTSVRKGFEQVWTRQRAAYSFSLPSLEGTIEWEGNTRVYIGIWQDDFH